MWPHTFCLRSIDVLSQSSLDTFHTSLNWSCLRCENQTWWCNQNAKRPHPPLWLFVLGDSSPAHLALMNPDTDYKPLFKQSTPALPTQFPHLCCQVSTTKRLALHSGGHVVNIWCDALLLANITDTIIVSADVETPGSFRLRERCDGLIQKVADVVKWDIWGWYKFDSSIIRTVKSSGLRERGAEHY